MISNLGNLMARRDLLRELTLSELRSQSAGTWLGWVWWLVDPLIMMLIYWAIVVGIFGRGENYAPYPVFVLCALLPYKYFTNSVNQSCNVLRNREALIKSIPFPTMALPISLVLSGLAYFLAGVVVLLASAVVTGLPAGGAWIQLPALFVFTVALVAGASLVVASVGAMLRDLSVLMSHFLRVLFYVSPTLYGVDMVQQRFGAGAAGDAGLAAWLPKLYMLNPFAALITGYREAVFYGHFLRLDFWALIVVQSLLLLWAGYQTYQYFDRRVIKFL